MQRIGVFVCWCGSNIAGTVDVHQVAESLKNEAGVVFSTDYQYMCSESGQNLIKDAIRDYHLTGVVICSCSPRMHEATFRKAAASVGLNPYMVEVANIREQCSWIHKDMMTATQKAIILGRAAIAKVHLNAPLTAGESPVIKRALVIGGGIAGIQTALDIADAGFEVDIVEKSPTIGGKMAQIDKTFPTLDCAACILTPKMVEAAQQEKIKIYSYSEVDDVKGFVGNFSVKIRKKARYVNEDICTGCGLCISHCPTRVLRPATTEYGALRALHPVKDYDAAMCAPYCTVCTDLCPTGALTRLSMEEKLSSSVGLAVVTRSDCLSYEYYAECGHCAEVCPKKAITMTPAEVPGYGSYPSVDPSLCIGCGACQFVCPSHPVKAIRVSGLS